MGSLVIIMVTLSASAFTFFPDKFDFFVQEGKGLAFYMESNKKAVIVAEYYGLYVYDGPIAQENEISYKRAYELLPNADVNQISVLLFENQSFTSKRMRLKQYNDSARRMELAKKMKVHLSGDKWYTADEYCKAFNPKHYKAFYGVDEPYGLVALASMGRTKKYYPIKRTEDANRVEVKLKKSKKIAKAIAKNKYSITTAVKHEDYMWEMIDNDDNIQHFTVLLKLDSLRYCKVKLTNYNDEAYTRADVLEYTVQTAKTLALGEEPLLIITDMGLDDNYNKISMPTQHWAYHNFAISGEVDELGSVPDDAYALAQEVVDRVYGAYYPYPNLIWAILGILIIGGLLEYKLSFGLLNMYLGKSDDKTDKGNPPPPDIF